MNKLINSGDFDAACAKQDALGVEYEQIVSQIDECNLIGKPITELDERLRAIADKVMELSMLISDYQRRQWTCRC
jgi:hypothetical protein